MLFHKYLICLKFNQIHLHRFFLNWFIIVFQMVWQTGCINFRGQYTYDTSTRSVREIFVTYFLVGNIIQYNEPSGTIKNYTSTTDERFRVRRLHLHSMLRQLLRKMDASATQIKAKVDQLNWRIKKYRTETHYHVSQCLEWWQVSDICINSMENVNITTVEAKIHEKEINKITLIIRMLKKIDQSRRTTSSSSSNRWGSIHIQWWHIPRWTPPVKYHTTSCNIEVSIFMSVIF